MFTLGAYIVERRLLAGGPIIRERIPVVADGRARGVLDIVTRR